MARISLDRVRMELRYCVLLLRRRLSFSQRNEWDASYAISRCRHAWPVD